MQQLGERKLTNTPTDIPHVRGNYGLSLNSSEGRNSAADPTSLYNSPADRDNHTCQHCKGKSKDHALEVHHLVSRQTGGNSPDNLITLCKTCHNKELNVSSSVDGLRGILI